MRKLPKTSFGLVESFEIDDDELAGLSQQECFSLGVEWHQWLVKFGAGKPFSDIALAANATRLVRLAERLGRFVEHHRLCNGWVGIVVGGYVV